MLETWPDKAEDIDTAVFFKKNGRNASSLEMWAQIQHERGEEYGPNAGPTPYLGAEDIWGTQMRVICEYRMIKQKSSVDYAVTINPGTYEEERRYIPAELKTPADKLQWLNENVPEWQPDQIFTEESEEDVQIMTAI